MMNDLYLYLFWFVNIACFALCDGKMWNRKEDDPAWTNRWIHIYWLGWVAVSPFLLAYLVGIGVPVLSWKSLMVAAGLSVVWDLIYCQHEDGVWVRDVLHWLKVPIPFTEKVWLIGFDRKHLIIFNWERFALLIVSLFIKTTP